MLTVEDTALHIKWTIEYYEDVESLDAVHQDLELDFNEIEVEILEDFLNYHLAGNEITESKIIEVLDHYKQDLIDFEDTIYEGIELYLDRNHKLSKLN